jgi:hypothetical protein
MESYVMYRHNHAIAKKKHLCELVFIQQKVIKSIEIIKVGVIM